MNALTNIAHAYITTNDPIDFTQNHTGSQLIHILEKHSREARFILATIFLTLEPLVCHDQIELQTLQATYLYATQLIHIKFGTS